ncbi:MAG: hypothetical protein ABIH67_00585 [Candidatus Uhrbacteria bacterium]
MANIPYNPDLLEQGKAVIDMALGLLTGQKDVDIVALTENADDDPDFDQIFPFAVRPGDDADEEEKDLFATAQALETCADELAESLHFELVEATEGQSVVDYLRALLACCGDRSESSQPLTMVAKDLSKIEIEDGGEERCYKLNKKRFKGTRQILIQVFGVDDSDVEEKPEKADEEKDDGEKEPDAEEMFGAGNTDFDDDDDPDSNDDDDDDDEPGHTKKKAKDKKDNKNVAVTVAKVSDLQHKVAVAQATVNKLVEQHYANLRRPKFLLRVATSALDQPRGGQTVGQMISELNSGQGIGGPYDIDPLVPMGLVLDGTTLVGANYTMFVRAVGRKLANQMKQLAAEAGVQLTR